LSQHLQQDIFPLNNDARDSAATYKETMLETAGHCYQEASECDGDDSGEEWLHHYMLGKIAEKQHAPPATYLEHYKQVTSGQAHATGIFFLTKIKLVYASL